MPKLSFPLLASNPGSKIGRRSSGLSGERSPPIRPPSPETQLFDKGVARAGSGMQVEQYTTFFFFFFGHDQKSLFLDCFFFLAARKLLDDQPPRLWHTNTIDLTKPWSFNAVEARLPPHQGAAMAVPANSSQEICNPN